MKTRPIPLFALALLMLTSSLAAEPLAESSVEPAVEPIEVAGITWMSPGRKVTKVELAVAHLSPGAPTVNARLVAADGRVVATFPTEFLSRRLAPIPGFEIIRVRVNTAPIDRREYRLEVGLIDPLTGRHDATNTPVAVSWLGGFSTPPRQVLFHACSDVSPACTETSSGVIVRDGADTYYAARPGSSGNPVHF